MKKLQAGVTIMEKIKRTYLLESQTVDHIERLARETRRTNSAIVDLALEEYAEGRDNDGGNGSGSEKGE